MSYCRFSEGDVYLVGTSVYVDESREEGFHCVGCILNPKTWVGDETAFLGGYLKSISGASDFSSVSRKATLAHLDKHVVAGHAVPNRAVEGLTAETEWGQP